MRDADPGPDAPGVMAPPRRPSSPRPTPGGSRELLALAAPLVLSQGFMTLQITIDRVLLSRHDPDEVAAAFPAALLYWLPFGLLQGTAGYVSTFVAQYMGAGRPHRVGPAVWQGLHFAIAAGLLFLLLVPLAPTLVALGGHDPALQRLEVVYLRCLAFAALPMALVAAVNGFFSGRGQTWTVLGVDACGSVVNAVASFVLVFGRFGLPELGIAGAGWGTVIGSWASAVLGLALFLRREYRQEFGTLAGWRPERELFGRLLRYGGPAGVQIALDTLAFTLFTLLVGRLGGVALAATSLAVTLNMLTFLPMYGLGQAVAILVGRRLGEDRPDLAERTAYTGLRWVFSYMAAVAVAYVTVPELLIAPFAPPSPEELARFRPVAALVPDLLVCVALYSLADSVNIIFACALRGAGDTRFVTAVTFALAWPVMVVPTWVVVEFPGRLGAGLADGSDPVYWAWGFATAYIVLIAAAFWARFRQGRWKTLRVIEPAG